MEEFKGTKEIHAVNFAGQIAMQDSPFYEGLNILDEEAVGKEVAEANAKLFEEAGSVRQQVNCSLTELLEKTKDLMEIVEKYGIRGLDADNSFCFTALKKVLNK